MRASFRPGVQKKGFEGSQRRRTTRPGQDEEGCTGLGNCRTNLEAWGRWRVDMPAKRCHWQSSEFGRVKERAGCEGVRPVQPSKTQGWEGTPTWLSALFLPSWYSSSFLNKAAYILIFTRHL